MPNIRDFMPIHAFFKVLKIAEVLIASSYLETANGQIFLNIIQSRKGKYSKRLDLYKLKYGAPIARTTYFLSKQSIVELQLSESFRQSND